MAKKIGEHLSKARENMMVKAREEGLDCMTTEEWVAFKSENKSALDDLWAEYEASEFDRAFAPTIARIHPQDGFVPDNCQVMTAGELWARQENNENNYSSRNDGMNDE